MITVQTIRVDDDPGDMSAPRGSESWARGLRGMLQGSISSAESQPRNFFYMVRLALDHRAWTFWKDAKGETFKTFEAFCEAPRPFGLAHKLRSIWHVLLAGAVQEMGDEGEAQRYLAAATVSEPRPLPPPPGPGRGHKATSHEGKLLLTPEEKKAALLRAVNRSPDVVKDAYRAGLIGQVEAAKLGPKNPAPDVAARVAAVARAVAPLIESSRTKPVAERRAVQREVNAKVREAFGVVKAPVPATRPTVGDLLNAMGSLAIDDLRSVIRSAQTVLLAKGVHVSVSFDEPVPSTDEVHP